MKILIIEDELLTAKDLKNTILDIYPYFEICQIVCSVKEGIVYLKKNRDIDIIFSDIQLGDGLSFEIFEKTNNQVPIIFCTAYNEYAMEAFRSLGIDYILKPFSEETIAKSIEKYLLISNKSKTTNNDYAQLMEMLKLEMNPMKTNSILVFRGEKVIPLAIDQIAIFYIEAEILYAYTFHGKKERIKSSLEVLQDENSSLFFRVNRQFLINKKAIQDISQHFNRKLLVNLNVPFSYQIIVTKLRVRSFLEWLKL